jgi:hypothetical protein
MSRFSASLVRDNIEMISLLYHLTRPWLEDAIQPELLSVYGIEIGLPFRQALRDLDPADIHGQA